MGSFSHIEKRKHGLFGIIRQLARSGPQPARTIGLDPGDGKFRPRSGLIVLALGSNQSGPWGATDQTLRRAVAELRHAGLKIVAASDVYETAPVGGGRQNPYANAVIAVESHLSPHALLRLLKSVEHRAGGRSARLWAPRALDIDIIDYKGLVRNWRRRGRSNVAHRRFCLVLPHGAAHIRPFVLTPLMQALPAWRHPVFRLRANGLLCALRQGRDGMILKQTQPLL